MQARISWKIWTNFGTPTSVRATVVSEPKPTIMQRVLRVVVLCSSFALYVANGADTPLEPSGNYQSIDVRLMHDTIQSLAKSDGKVRAQIISGITGKPENFAPPVLYFLSKILFDEGQKDEAIFW